MIYLSQFKFPGIDKEEDFVFGQRRTCYDTYYPFQVLTKNQLTVLDFEPVTILYGGNGSGKTTALNVIGEKLQLQRDTLYNRTNFFEDYTDLCLYKTQAPIPEGSRIITSDDVFDFMLNLRTLNNGIDQKREEIFKDYIEKKYTQFQMQSLDDYEHLKKVSDSRRKSQSQYVRKNLADNLREHSNGESAFMYFMEKMENAGLYLLDEPENSLSPERQQELLKFLEESARFFDYQFIIATHSPFLLSMKGAKIYDLDEEPVYVKKWTQLENVRAYYDFFNTHRNEFQ